MQDAPEDFAVVGAGVVLIGQATPADAQHFRDQCDASDNTSPATLLAALHTEPAPV